MIPENIKQELIVFLLGAAPISELRGAIPVGLLIFNFSIIKTFILAVVGNILPVLPLFLIIKNLSEFLIKRSEIFKKIFTWIFEHTRKKHGNHFDKWKYAPLALFIFVAIPLPMTGAWSGVLAAIVFGLSTKESFVSISAGVFVAGIIVTILTKLGMLTANLLIF